MPSHVSQPTPVARTNSNPELGFE